MSVSQRLTNQFKASDEDENRYDVLEYTDFHQVQTFNTEPTEEEGLKQYLLRDGSPVNRISDTEFQIVTTGTKLTKV